MSAHGPNWRDYEWLVALGGRLVLVLQHFQSMI